MLDEFRQPARRSAPPPQLFGPPAGRRRRRAAQAFHAVEERFKALGEELLPESRIAARARQVDIGDRRKPAHGPLAPALSQVECLSTSESLPIRGCRFLTRPGSLDTAAVAVSFAP